MPKSDFIKQCANKIVEFYGESFREEATRLATKYVDGYPDDVDEWPAAAATLIMEGLSMRRR